MYGGNGTCACWKGGVEWKKDGDYKMTKQSKVVCERCGGSVILLSCGTALCQNKACLRVGKPISIKKWKNSIVRQRKHVLEGVKEEGLDIAL